MSDREEEEDPVNEVENKSSFYILTENNYFKYKLSWFSLFLLALIDEIKLAALITVLDHPILPISMLFFRNQGISYPSKDWSFYYQGEMAGFRATLEKVPILGKLRENLENSGEKIENWNDSGKTQVIFLTGINYTKLNLHNLFLCVFVVV